MTSDDVREIERLKARYCRTLDTKQWAEFREVFTDEFVSDTRASGGRLIEGADEFVDYVRRALHKAVTVHQVQTYEKADGQWRITSSRLTRLREEIRTPVLTMFVSDRVRRLLQRAIGG